MALDSISKAFNTSLMNRTEIENAISKGRPFLLTTADGKEYTVPHPDYKSLPPNGSYVIVFEDSGAHNTLPLLTLTGLRYPLSLSECY